MSRKECREYCGRKAAKSSETGHCCRPCERSQGYGEHSPKCDERAENG